MSEDILNWVNTQLVFPYKIKNIEEEFSNGYYFGKLLEANKVFDNMKDLKNTKNKKESINNYSLLKNAFNIIGVRLSDSDINELINKKKYKAELYLYEIKQKISLKNCNFNEIMQKIKHETNSNNNLNIQKKRNQSAKPALYDKKKMNINHTYDELIPDNNKINKNNRIKSATRNVGKLNLKNHKSRLNSAKLPNLNKTQIKDRKKKLLYNNNKSNEEELAEEKQIQSVLNEINIFENIHMKKNIKYSNNNFHNPWDKNNYIYNNDNNILNINQKNEEKKNLTFLDLKDLENRKDSSAIFFDNNLSKLKSNLNNHNLFKTDNKKKLINKKNFEQGLSRMGLIANNMLPTIAKIKDNNIPSEIVLKSINETLKEARIKKKELLNNNNLTTPKNKKVYTVSLNKKNKKLKLSNIINNDSSQKRPLSSLTYNNKIKKDSKLDSDIDIKQNSFNKKRPSTAKGLKKNVELEKNLNKINDIQQINEKYKLINKNYEKKLSKISESDFRGEIDSNKMNKINSFQEEEEKEEEKEKEDFNEDTFFKGLNKEKINIKTYNIHKRKKENILNKNYMREIISSIIDMTEVYYDYQITKNIELIDIDKWHEIKYKFIYNKPIIKKKKKKRVLTEEEIGNYNFDVFTPINEEYCKNYGINEIDEMKNYLSQIGNKYDRNKNNLFLKKINLKEDNIEINDVMGDDIKLLFDKAKAEGIDIDEEDEEEFKRTGKIKYRPSKEEEEVMEPCRTFIPEYSFTNLISELIEFGYNKDPKTIYCIKDGVSQVIEEPKKENSFDKKDNEDVDKKLSNMQENNNNNENDNIINNNTDNNNLLKELLKSIPIKLAFIGILNNEIKMTIKSSINKYPKMKIYNPIEFLKDLRQKKAKIDEPINEQYLRKYQIDQLKKEKNNLIEEIKEYIDLIENKNNLTDDEICIKILQKKIKEDFEMKNTENIKQEITNRREQIKNLTIELNKVREEQQKKQKTNLRELQVYQQQLDKIEIDSMVGFIIINFPNTIEQSKLIEEKMIGFIQPCEQNKSLFDEINDKLLFLCDKEQKDSKFVKFNSFLEKIVYFYCDNSKLFPEKTVPQNPIPTPSRGSIMPVIAPDEFTKSEVEDYINKYKDLEEFYQNFNIQIDKYDYYEGLDEENINLNNNYNNNLNMNSNNYMIRDRILLDKLKSTLNIYEEKNVPKLNSSILMEESCEEGLEEGNSGDSSLKHTIGNNSKQQNKQQMRDSNNSSSLKKEISKIPSLKNNNVSNNINTNNNSNNDINNNANNNINNNPAIDKQTSQKQMIINKNPIILTISQISDEEKMNIYQMWYKFNIQYNYYCYRLFYRERTIKRMKAEHALDDIQKNFIQFLSNSKEPKIIVNQFVQKYKTFRDNYCKSKKINSESNKIIIQNYQKDLVELSETLWNISKIRKNLAFEEIEKLEKDNLIETELIFCYYKMERLIILESQRLIVIINIFIKYYYLTFSTKLNSSNTQPQFSLDISLAQEILKDVEKEELAKQKKDKKIIYPRANRLYKNCFRLLMKIYIFLDSFYSSILVKDKKGNITSANYKSLKSKKIKKSVSGKPSSFGTVVQLNSSKVDLSNQIKNTIKIHMKKYKNNMYNLYMISLENLSKIYCPFNQVLKLMDDWIILSMELQNKKIKETIKYLDLTNNFKSDGDNINKKLNNKIEKEIVESIIKEDNDIYNYEYSGINQDEFILFDINKYIGISNLVQTENHTDDDCLKLYDIFKDLDILTKLRNNEIQKGIITKSKFEEIFFKNFLLTNFDKFPKEFNKIDYHNITSFLSYFTILSSELKSRKNDNENSEMIEGKPQELIYTNDIITILLLSCIFFNFNILKENENDENNEVYINKEKFMEINFGFENEIEIISDKNKSNDFKLYLFNIHKNNNDIPEINIKNFKNILSLKKIKNAAQKEVKKYFDLFSY